MDFQERVHTIRKQLAADIATLSETRNSESLTTLRDFLLNPDPDPVNRSFVPGLVSIALLHHGKNGVKILADILLNVPRLDYRRDIFGVLWYGSKGKIPDLSIFWPEIPSPLLTPLPNEVINEASTAISEFIAEATVNNELFDTLLSFLYFDNSINSVQSSPEQLEDYRIEVMEILTQGTIKISYRLIAEFELLVQQDGREEDYHQFLKQHPVFLDPLASEVISKQKLGLEFVTDFVVRRYDGRWLLVEIEKPQDELFTTANDFTSRFTHAFGQVLDFQQWVETHSEYARTLMPGISSPTGLLVMGRRERLSDENSNKLHRYNVNSSSIEIVTFDDLIVRAKNLYQNIYLKPFA